MNEKRSQRKFRKFALVLTALLAAAALLIAIPVLAKSALTAAKVHETHLTARVGLECAQCHADTPKHSGVNTAPVKTAACAACHDMPKSLGFEERTPAKRAVLFSHAAHIDLGKKCLDCHKGAVETAVAMPAHPQCAECHKDDYDGMLCAKCHTSFETIGLKKLSSYKHANDFKSRHPEYARKSVKACAQCHSESYCSDCHSKREGLKPDLKYPEKVRSNLIHRGDWITVHRLEARTDSSSCLKCHVIASCNKCHAERGVGSRSEKVVAKHSPDWMTKGSDDFHGDKARTDIVACAACHNRGGPGDCRICHKASAGRNPHPKNWNPQGLSQKDPMCSECHSH